MGFGLDVGAPGAGAVGPDALGPASCGVLELVAGTPFPYSACQYVNDDLRRLVAGTRSSSMLLRLG